MLTIKGTGIKAGEVPATHEDALRYFHNVHDFLWKLPDVESVKPLSREHCYLIVIKPIGGLNYYVTVASALEAKPTPKGLELTPLDFDTEKIKSDHQVLKGFVSGGLLTEGKGAATSIDFNLKLEVEFPLPGALKLVPRGLIQSTADGIMNLRMGMIVDALHGKVLEDFKLLV
ncbi:MAG TPA: DUF1997 domain-containing protein [Oscillatoriaceae cyanobacterium]